MPTASINGFDLHYEVCGDGPPLVWLHGLMGSIARERQFGEGLHGLEARGFRFVCYDARGHGASGATDDESHYTWPAHAADMLALMDHVGLERAHVGGGSMGAGVALALALAAPERVEKLVLLAPPQLDGDIGPAGQVFVAFASLIESLGLEQAVNVALQLPQFVELKESRPEEYEQTRQWLLSLDPRGSVLAIRGLVNGARLPAERFAEVRAPALIIAQPDDPVHPQSAAEQLHASLGGSRLVVAPAAGHYRGHPEQLLDAVAAFLLGSD